MEQQWTIRLSAPQDAAALLDIYTPYITDTAVTFEYDVPTAEEFAARVREISAWYPYLVCERAGEIAGYAYAHRLRERAGQITPEDQRRVNQALDVSLGLDSY